MPVFATLGAASKRGVGGIGGITPPARYWRLRGNIPSGATYMHFRNDTCYGNGIYSTNDLSGTNYADALVPGTSINFKNGSDVTDNTYAGNSSTHAWRDSAASVASSGSYQSYIQLGSGTPEGRVYFDFGSAITIKSIKHEIVGNRYPATCYLEFSLNNTSWYPYATLTGGNAISSGSFQNITQGSTIACVTSLPSYRYWRLRATTAPTGGYWDILNNDYDNIINGTSQNGLVAGTTLKMLSSTNSNISNYDGNPFDDGISRRMYASAETNMKLWIDFTSAVSFRDFRARTYQLGGVEYSDRQPDAMTVEYSSDNSTWTSYCNLIRSPGSPKVYYQYLHKGITRTGTNQ